ncbi:YceI family protein [Zunongwangia sp. SCSIO 43204]|uniref:YceI family protein n=1 Tax=Zunongwangia sp. SCSIO 43204 TaxID=2779359 RepID=UPI001CA7D6AC|nr:YceI family protein [Zunongwangia sp. SCSIO 43204]UAB84844.1 YceI family protein [Zunongwangia sp. SCSIO 43204]
MRTKSLNYYSVFALLIFLFVGASGNSQNLKPIKTEILVEGTSNIHDWEMTSEKAVANVETNSGNVSKISVEIPVKSLESGKGGMDKNAYKALNEDDYPTVKFSSTEVSASKITGKLTINGKTKTVAIPVSTKKASQGVEISGKHTINMTDFGIEPPTALMGTIKTGEEVTINFNFQVNQ